MSLINQKKSANDPALEVNVESIMASIREKMRENRRTALAQGLKPRQFVFADYPEEPTSGNYDSELYAHLHQVNQPHQILGVRRIMRSSFLTKLPVVGSMWRRIQHESHDLVIFYVNSLANEVVDFQRHVAGALNRLVSWRQEKDVEIRLLQEEVKALKERLDLLEAKK